MSDAYQSLSHSKWDCKYHVYSCPSDGVRYFSGKFVVIWERYSMHWPGRKSARFWKGICCRIMCICVSRFPQASGGFGDRVCQGEERYCHCPTVW